MKQSYVVRAMIRNWCCIDPRCEAGLVTPRHLALGLLVAVIWGVNFVAIDLGLRDTLPLVLVALRFALVAVPLVFLVPKPDAPWRVIAGIGLFMSAGQFGLLFTAMHLGLPAGLAAVVLQCQMIFTLAIGAVALRERPTRMQLVGAARRRGRPRRRRARGGSRSHRASPRSSRCSSASPPGSAGASAT